MDCLYFFQLSLFLFLKFGSWRYSFIVFIASFYCQLHYMKILVLNLNEGSRNISKISVGQSPNPHWPELGALGSPWPSLRVPWNVMTIGELHWSLKVGTFRPSFHGLSVSPQLRINVAWKASQAFVAILLTIVFLILHDVETRFSIDAFFFW